MPGFNELSDAWEETFDTLCNTRAEALPGLQAKAKAMLLGAVVDDNDRTREVAHSLARDLQRATNKSIEPFADPILSLIEENGRLAKAYDEVCETSPETEEVRQDRAETGDAVMSHWRDVVLKTVPTTAAGCAALARYAADFYDVQGPEIDEDPRPLLRLLAKSPLL